MSHRDQMASRLAEYRRSPELQARVELVAEQLACYLRERAAAEGVPCELDAEFFRTHLVAGIRTFFGILVSLDHCELVEDDQEPDAGFLAAWKLRRTA